MVGRHSFHRMVRGEQFTGMSGLFFLAGLFLRFSSCFLIDHIDENEKRHTPVLQNLVLIISLHFQYNVDMKYSHDS